MKKRLDIYLVDKGYFSSRSKAKDAIKGGKIKINGVVVEQANKQVQDADEIELLEAQQFVGRGAKKLKGAIDQFGLSFDSKIAVDIGASTGGFTEVLLQEGCSRVFAVDVGHDQMQEDLKNDPRVVNMEGTNIRHLESLPEKVAIVVWTYLSSR